MRPLLERIWQLPWPSWLRRIVSHWAALPLIRAVLFPRFMVGVVGIIQDAEGKVLLLHHTYRSMPWGLPTGFLEHGEQPINALAREIREEAGLEVQLGRQPIVYTEKGVPLLNIIFRGKYVGGDFEASAEVSQVGWFPLTALPTMLPSQKALIEFGLQEVTH